MAQLGSHHRSEDDAVAQRQDSSLDVVSAAHGKQKPSLIEGFAQELLGRFL
jgi:hypothetical protein